MSNNAKKNMKHPENTNKTCFEAFKEICENPVLGSNIRFSPQMWNNDKNTLKLRKHQLNMFWGFLRIFENPVLGSKIRFSAQMSNNAKNTLKHSEKTN